MCLDENNQRVLGNILGIKSSTDRALIYQKYFRSQFTTNNGMLNLVEREQVGGDPKQVQINIGGNDYIFTINEVDGELINVEGRKYQTRQLYFFSLYSDSTATSCIWLTVNPKSNIGYVNGIAKKFQCIGVSSGRGFPMEPLVGENQGAILIQALIKFCRFHAKRLGIVRLELGDIAERECADKDGAFLISESNMLQGREPYYMKFGFRPSNATMRDKIVANITKMKSEVLEAKDLIYYLERRTRRKLSGWLEEFLVANDGKLVSEVLNRMMVERCDIYVKYYVDMYRYYELYELRGRELVYELMLY